MVDGSENANPFGTDSRRTELRLADILAGMCLWQQAPLCPARDPTRKLRGVFVLVPKGNQGAVSIAGGNVRCAGYGRYLDMSTLTLSAGRSESDSDSVGESGSSTTKNKRH